MWRTSLRIWKRSPPKSAADRGFLLASWTSTQDEAPPVTASPNELPVTLRRLIRLIPGPNLNSSTVIIKSAAA
jgi:hypothetical protein